MKDIQAIEFLGIPLFKRHENVLKSEIFGVPAWAVLIAGGVIWLLRR